MSGQVGGGISQQTSVEYSWGLGCSAFFQTIVFSSPILEEREGEEGEENS